MSRSGGPAVTLGEVFDGWVDIKIGVQVQTRVHFLLVGVVVGVLRLAAAAQAIDADPVTTPVAMEKVVTGAPRSDERAAVLAKDTPGLLVASVAAPVTTGPTDPSVQAGSSSPGIRYVPYETSQPDKRDSLGSAYIPVDSWVYPAMTRLYSLGYLDSMFLGMRPYTRRSALHMLKGSEYNILNGYDAEAQGIYSALMKELRTEAPENGSPRGTVYGVYSGYTRLMGIGGQTLRDSYHLGQTINNDYGRPYQSGFNNITGFSTLNERGRFSLHVRGEYQHAPSGTGYTYALASQLSAIEEIPYATNRPQATIPEGPIAAQNPFRLVEATLSIHLLGHEISGGKSDAWLGPGMGGAMAWSNNAENIYSFRINRVEPLSIPYVSKLLGPVRYDFFYGSLKGHSVPNSPYVHAEMFSFRPTVNFEFGFQRTVIFGGEGHAPVTLHTFLKGFFDIADTTQGEKYSRNDPGARYSDFNFSYRLPFVRKYATLYVDSIAHDDVTPPSAPRRAAYRTGIYLSQIPGVRKMDLRVEAVTTDPPVLRSLGGSFNYFEIVQLQGYTNKGYIMGDWIGREAKGGQAWLTYHLSGNEWVQLAYMNKKTPKDFIPGGTTQNQFKLEVVKRLLPEVELDAWYQYEGWKAPIYKAGLNNDSIFSGQITWYPKLRTRP